MKRVITRTLVVLVAAGILLAVALPFAAPPIVKAIAEAKLTELGYPATVSMKLGYGWNGGPEIGGSLNVRAQEGPWKIRATFGAGIGTWHAKATLPSTDFSESDPLLARLLETCPLPSVSNLVFSGRIALEAAVERTRQMPVPVWSARAPVRIEHVSLSADGTDISAAGIALAPAASGISRHMDVTPLAVRASALVADGFALTNLYASVRVEEKAVFVTEAGAGVCGGKVNLYSLFLNPETLNTGFTLFVDNVDAGKILAHVKGFSGDASGRLHGKVRVFVRNGGKAVRFSDAYLYSTPGESGKLEMSNPECMTDNLALAGIDATTCGNVANALADLDYSVLRLDLKRLDGNAATLSVRIKGSATRGDLTVPVDLNININGDLEQIINTGLGYSNKLKGTEK